MRTIIFPAVFGCFFLAFLSGCAYEPAFGPQIFYVDANVKRTGVRVHVAPENTPARPLTALIFPFPVQQDMDHAKYLEKELTAILWQAWNHEQVFPAFSYSETPWPGLESARDRALSQNRDLVVYGSYPYLIMGGSQGTTTIAVHIEIFDARTGFRIWSMDHTGSVARDFDRDYILFRKKTRMSQDPVFSVMSTVALDMAHPLTQWNMSHPMRPRTKDKTAKTPPAPEKNYIGVQPITE